MARGRPQGALMADSKPSEHQIKQVERYRYLSEQARHLNEALPRYFTVAGALLFLSGLFGPGGDGADHPMFLMGTGIATFVGAGGYWLWVRERIKNLDREIRSVEVSLRSQGCDPTAL